MSSSAIAIIGMAGRFPGANSLDVFWTNLRDGVESITFFELDELRAQGVSDETLRRADYVRAKGVLRGADSFDRSLFGVGEREAALIDPQQRVFLECALSAFEHAGYVPAALEAAVGVFAGATMNTYLLQALRNDPTLVEQVGISQLLVASDKDFLPTRVSYKLGLRGPSLNVQTACSTSLVAVHVACQSLNAGECDLALAGGVSITVPLISGYQYRESGILSPDGHCRAFDARGQGTVMGNGVGVVLLKRLDDALADGDEVHAVIRGSAVNNDGRDKVGFTAPSLSAQVAVIREALGVAGLSPSAVDYIEAHGTGTRYGDPIEVAALSTAFADRQRRGRLPIGSVKTNIGHLDAAAGIAGLLKTVLALKHRMLPASLHFERPNPEIDFERSPLRVQAEACAWEASEPRRAGVSSFGFGGTNVHVVLEEAPQRASRAEVMPSPHVIVLSGHSADAISAQRQELAAHLERANSCVADVARTLQSGRTPMAFRSSLILPPGGDLHALLRSGAGHSGAGGSMRELVFVFPGQGALTPGMGTVLYRELPVFARQLDELFELAASLGTDLRTPLLGRSSERLAETELGQPATFALSLALAETFRSWGMTPAALLGHSLGELAAATFAGVLSTRDGMRLVLARGKAMQACPPGTLLAVVCPEHELRPLLSPGLYVSAINAPRQTVVGGSHAQLDQLAGSLRSAGIACTLLRAPRAFHTPSIEAALPGLRESLAGVSLGAPSLPFVSTISGRWLEPEQARDPEYWVEQALAPVQFSQGLQTVLSRHSAAILEVGPGDTLTRLIRQNPSARAATAHASLPTSEAGSARLIESLGRLWADGVSVEWGRVHAQPFARVSLPPRAFSVERCWLTAAEPRAEASAPPPMPAVALAVERKQTFPVAGSNVARAVAAAFSGVLGRESAQPHDNFFELGGESLLGIDLLTRLRESLGVQVGLSELLARPTLAALTELVEQRVLQGEPLHESAPPLVLLADPARRHEPFPLTPVQLAYFVGRRFVELGGVGSHAYFELELEQLDVRRLERAFQLLVERHEMLRAVVLEDGQQCILQDVPALEIELLDLSGESPARADERLAMVRAELSHKLYSGLSWPLFELRATLLPGHRPRLHFSFDFLIGDAWSLSLLLREAARLYRDPSTQLPPLKVSFRDYAVAVAKQATTESYAGSLAFWREKAARLPSPPELPLARPAASVETSRFRRYESRVAADRWNTLKQRAAHIRVTPTALLLTAFSEVLATWSRKKDFTLNLTVFNRPALDQDMQALIGDFTSLLVVPVSAAGSESFEHRACSLQRELWQVLEHKQVSAIQVARELARAAGVTEFTLPVVFTSTLGLADDSVALDTAGLGARLLHGVSQTPQVWLDHQVYEQAGALLFQWDVVDQLLPASITTDMFEAYASLLHALSEPSCRWSQFVPGCLTPEAQLELAARTNATDATRSEAMLDQLFVERAHAQPHALAVITPSRKLSYAELEQWSASLASYLGEHALAAARIAVVMHRGWEQVVGVMGTLRAGGAYVPIDVALPDQRIHELLQSSQVGAVLTMPGLLSELELSVPVLELRAPGAGLDGLHCRNPGRLLASSLAPPARSADDLAYIIHTSGSTGVPKGVAVEHRAAVNTILDINRRFHVGSRDRVLALSSLSFDLSVFDIFGLLAAGGAVVIPDMDRDRSPAHWLELMQGAEVTLWNSVPALMELMVEHCETQAQLMPPGLACVMMSGDWIPVSLPGRVRERTRSCRIYSLGGATEAAIWSIYYPIEEIRTDWKSIPYGYPLSNQRVHVLDEQLEPRPVGVPGELYLAGLGLAREYWNDSERTALQFVRHPRTCERLYRTGDWGRRGDDGNIEFLGREDLQVKIRGHRIELSEIEAKLAQCPAVEACAVVATGSAANSPRLVACLVLKPNFQASEREACEAAREYLRGRLPAYMLPARLTVVQAMPLTRNRKVDRDRLRKLAELELEVESASAPYAAPRAGLESFLADGWSALLGGRKVGAEDDVFVLGVDSLMAIRAHAALERSPYGRGVLLRELYAYPTVRLLAHRLERGAAERTQQAPGGE